MPRSTISHLPSAAVEIDVHANLARTAEREEQQFPFGREILFQAVPALSARIASPSRVKVGIDRVEDVGMLVEQDREAAGRDDSSRGGRSRRAIWRSGLPSSRHSPRRSPISIWSSVLRPITLSDAGASIAMRGNLAVFPDQCVEREVDPRGDDPALVGAVEIDHIEGGRGAEIDHNQIARDISHGRQWH